MYFCEEMAEYTINLRGCLMDLESPKVMGILNVTPDSFFCGSRAQSPEIISGQVRRMIADGADIIDIGACSTRPGGAIVSESEEMSRLRSALKVITHEATGVPLSIDTFRPDVAKMCVGEYGVAIINDVGNADTREEMFRTAAALRVPYILMSTQPTLHDMLITFSREVQQLRDLGQKDIIIDPGFGFGKTLEQNYAILSELENLAVLGLPVLVGISRKSMIQKVLGLTADESLNGTTVLNAISLMKGASILRVHDVREARETVLISSKLSNSKYSNSKIPHVFPH